MKEATLCLLVRDNPVPEVLLGWKKVGFGANKYAGFGGKVEPGETIPQAAVRELEEETGIRIPEQSLLPAGCLTFLFPARPSWSQAVHLFLVRAWEGQAHESREMQPRWFPVSNLPFDQMWQDSAHWLPPVLDGQGVRARFTFESDNETIAAMTQETWLLDTGTR